MFHRRMQLSKIEIGMDFVRPIGTVCLCKSKRRRSHHSWTARRVTEESGVKLTLLLVTCSVDRPSEHRHGGCARASRFYHRSLVPPGQEESCRSIISRIVCIRHECMACFEYRICKFCVRQQACFVCCRKSCLPFSPNNVSWK